MKITDRWEDLVHTHFVTDAVRLPSERLREIERGVLPLLRESGIVFGIHFAHSRKERTIRIVLECRPPKKELDAIQSQIARIVERIPAKPPTVKVVRRLE